MHMHSMHLLTWHMHMAYANDAYQHMHTWHMQTMHISPLAEFLLSKVRRGLGFRALRDTHRVTESTSKSSGL
jgi:hypothetical protein